jgi:hypothetical protein
MRTINPFWLAYASGATLDLAFAERDRPGDPLEAEALDMNAWLRLTEPERNAIIDRSVDERGSYR